MKTASFEFINWRQAPSIDSQPRMSIFEWRIVELVDGTVLVGLLENGFTCRMTTLIERIDYQRREVTTQSGRIYELCGMPATKSASGTITTARIKLEGPRFRRDVTSKHWEAMRRAAS